MADLTVQITFRGTVGGKAVTWTRTGTVADIESIATVASDTISSLGFQGRVGPDPTFTAGTDSPHNETGMAFCAIAGTGSNGALLYSIFDPTLSVEAYQAAQHGLPILLYAGYDMNGGFNSGTSATATPQEDLGNVFVSSIVGPLKFQALYALKPVS